MNGTHGFPLADQVCYNYKRSNGTATQDIENGVTREAHQQAGMEKDSSALLHNGVSEDASIVTPSDPPGIG